MTINSALKAASILALMTSSTGVAWAKAEDPAQSDAIEDIIVTAQKRSESPFENVHGWTMRRSMRLPRATWIMASETSRRCS